MKDGPYWIGGGYEYLSVDYEAWEIQTDDLAAKGQQGWRLWESTNGGRTLTYRRRESPDDNMTGSH